MPQHAPTLLRLAAFTTEPSGGNPAGVWIGGTFPTDAEMQRIAAEVGYSETAFLVPDEPAAPGRFRVRYFSPLAEVPFCGHATIASGVALAERGLAAPPARAGDPRHARPPRRTAARSSIATAADGRGMTRATLTSVATWVREPDPDLLATALDASRLAASMSSTRACLRRSGSRARGT